ncbi:hypothetical protein ACF0H5_017134 [Mactra antiquata]
MGRKRLRTNGHVVKSLTKPKASSETSSSYSGTKSTSECQNGISLQKEMPRNNDNRKHKTGDDNNTRLFPHWTIWIIFPVTLAIRLSYVLEPRNWWTLHPDELYQTIEVAHTDAYGYGFRPYEYTEPLYPDAQENSTLSEARLQELRLGMYSLRSFILPKILSMIMIIADLCGISWSPFLVIKVFHVMLTSTLPVSVFHLSKSIHSSRDVATLSAILVSSSLSLNIFGTHTFINSFLAPLALLSLATFVKIIKKHSSYIHTEPIGRHQFATDSKNQLPYFVQLFKSALNRLWCTENANNVNACELESEISQKSGLNDENTISDTKMAESNKASDEDENANIINSPKSMICEQRNESDFKETTKRQSVHGLLPFDTELFVPLLSIDKSQLTELICGALLALCIYIRIDLVLIPSLLFVVNWNFPCEEMSTLLQRFRWYLIGTTFGVLIGGAVDFVTYGVMFISPMQWFKFNFLNDLAGEIFGVHSRQFYISKLFQNEPLFIMCSVITMLAFLSHLLICKKWEESVNNWTLLRAAYQNLFIFITLTIAYSSNSHKEFRFLHNAIVFFYLSSSCATVYLYQTFTRLFCNQNGRQYSIYSVYLFILLFFSSHLHSFITMSHADKTKWTYAKNIDSQNDNTCLDFIRNQNDVTGVFLDSSLNMAGVYSIMHKDVPIFGLKIYEFMEYNNRKSNDVTRRMNSIGKKGYFDFTDVSEFISIRNTPLLLKQLINQREYNYIILKTKREFVNIGYEEVFRAGNSKVLKRTYDEKSELSLAEISADIMIGSNSTVLEYEGSWLKHFGLYAKAEKRLVFANRLDPTRIGPFRVLLEMYKTLNQVISYKNVLSACMQVHTSENCLRVSEPIVLHKNYYKD